ncbi:protein LAZY 1-like isoform X1 [Vigna umbellata]|uniref:protein LAZY 1-like isoform X1 n=1 Tax=Vigna umbellata TaxID=87088 RepID=UPI001F5FCACF|nr:protein LAZY 1-like isoform X1 [Vigna umbellata]
MKLLGWMHRKFRQNSSEPFKDLVIGNSCNCLSGQPPFDDEQAYPKPNLGIRLAKHAQKGHNLRNSFAGLEAARVDEEYEGEFFPGFLAIGTLGSEQVSDPSTPSFPVSVESITEKEDEVTENDLKLINDELEKVLGAETKDDVSLDSSRRTSHVSTGRSSHVSTGRSSHVSTGRSSHVSIITLSGKPIEGTEPNGNGAAICPLQGYLFGTAIELSETTAAAKKEHRTSLGELFQRSKSAEENFSAKCEKEEKRTEKELDKSAMNLMKEKLKKRMLHAYSKNSTSINGGPIDSASAETKLNKILHMFRKKVHPESSTAAQKSAKHHKNMKKKKILNDGGYNKNDLVHPEDEDSSANREYWIKTDADYLVLEL